MRKKIRNTKGPKKATQDRKRHPFIIHAFPVDQPPFFPTHTHGLTKIGWPEFIMDPLALGPEGNGQRINYAYEYFSKSQNHSKLQEILTGKTTELTSAELFPHKNFDEACTYCFRVVPATFEGVKTSYPNPGEITPEMRFVQIYIKGDDYVLTDEYYRGGVTW